MTLVVQVLTELEKTAMLETCLQDPRQFVHGPSMRAAILATPTVKIVDALVHEVLHRLYPGWTEGYVRNRVTWLMRQMSDEQLSDLYAAYQTVRRRWRRSPRMNVEHHKHGHE